MWNPEKHFALSGCEILPRMMLGAKWTRGEGALGQRVSTSVFIEPAINRDVPKALSVNVPHLLRPKSNPRSVSQKLGLCSTKADLWITVAPMYTRFPLMEHRLVILNCDLPCCELKYPAMSCSIWHSSCHEVWMWTPVLQQLLSWKLPNV